MLRKPIQRMNSTKMNAQAVFVRMEESFISEKSKRICQRRHWLLYTGRFRPIKCNGYVFMHGLPTYTDLTKHAV